MTEVGKNIQEVRARIAAAAERSGRKETNISLVAVTKTVASERINEAIEAGIDIIGENRLQETEEKRSAVKPVRWHMIGHLQRNKVKDAVEIYEMIQSVDSLRLAKEINKRCAGHENKMPVLMEVNTSGEKSKFGCTPEQAESLAEQIAQLPHLHLQGLMTIGLFSEDPEAVRPGFIRLRELGERIEQRHFPGVEMKILSMGMSADFELAIEEGANMVRIGSAIFGARNY